MLAEVCTADSKSQLLRYYFQVEKKSKQVNANTHIPHKPQLWRPHSTPKRQISVREAHTRSLHTERISQAKIFEVLKRVKFIPISKCKSVDDFARTP